MAATSILWVEDAPAQIKKKVEYLEDYGYEVDVAVGPQECFDMMERRDYDLVVLDIMMRHADEFDSLQTAGGIETGLALARQIKKAHPSVPLVGCSVADDEPVVTWFKTHGAGFWLKTELRPNRAFLRKIELATGASNIPPQIFIVHGHSETRTLELKNYLQNQLRLGEPVILREQPSLGKTLIEKFEQAADDAEIVFVILTPDDAFYTPGHKQASSRRSRQNVIFELGYFFGRMRRRSGRVLLLYEGPLDLPTDVNGIGYIDIGKGIESAGEEIRREISAFG